MKTRYFEKVNFWARELRMPLFRLTDPQHKIFREDVLVFYKDNVIHLYNLNDGEIIAAKKGYKFFSNESNIKIYKRQVNEIRELIKRVSSDCKNLKINKLTNDELQERVSESIGFLNSYSDTYAKTEPFFLSKIEADKKKYKKIIKQLGSLRLTLKKEGGPLFYNLFNTCLKEIAKRFNLKVWDLFFYQFEELNKLFKGQRVKRDIIEKRKKGYALICIKNKKILLTGKKFKILYKNIVLPKLKTNELVGQTAVTGRVKGRARVILHNKRLITKEVAMFRKREILVTEMTRPDTIMACKRASAIVTDEGGITSHAAIISRELKIPCVIATKIATQVIKSGDIIDVNANEGIVKILKRR